MTGNEYQKLAARTMNPALRGRDVLINGVMGLCGEAGEAIDIVKKHGGENAAANEDVRVQLVEELADVLMYYNDVLLCYGIGAEELKRAYTEKFEKNMTRW